MGTRLALAVTALLALLGEPAAAGTSFYDGYKIHEMIASDNRFNARLIVDGDIQEQSRLTGYVVGVADSAILARAICPNNDVKVGQMVAIASQYVEAHPQEWNVSGALLIGKALAEAFPCGK